ncbi:hypothetical protein D3C78_823210 [compost metagenome]
MLVALLRTFNPEFAETREFFAGWQRSINRQATCGKPVNLPFTYHAEVARAQQAHNFVVLIRTVDRINHLETGEAEVFYRIRIVLHRTKVEVVRAVLDLLDGGRGDLVDFHRRVEVHTLMIKLKLEWGFQLAPIGFIVIELNLLIVREFHLTELRRKVAFRSLEAFPCQILRLLGHIINRKSPCWRSQQREQYGRT